MQPKSLLSFSNDPKVLNFINKFLSTETATTTSSGELELQQIITLQFYNCLTKDRMHALPIYTNLLMALRRLVTPTVTNISMQDIWQFKLIDAIVRNSPHNQHQLLLSAENIRSLSQRVASQMEHWTAEMATLLRRFLLTASWSLLQLQSGAELQRLAALISYYDLPIGMLAALALGDDDSGNSLSLLLAFRDTAVATHTIQAFGRILTMSAAAAAASSSEPDEAMQTQ